MRLWRPIVTTVVAVAAVGVSIYLTLVHYAGAPLACSSNGAINCEKVITSPQSVIFGIPVAVYGLAFWVVAVALSLPPMWRATATWIATARMAFATVGIVFVLYLIYVELFEVRAICLWCTSVHALTFVFFLLVVTGWQDTGAGARIDGAGG